VLREFYPAALEAFNELDSGDALAVLAIAPTPELGRRLSISKIGACQFFCVSRSLVDGQIRPASRSG
jgi:hypothetical protein